MPAITAGNHAGESVSGTDFDGNPSSRAKAGDIRQISKRAKTANRSFTVIFIVSLEFSVSLGPLGTSSSQISKPFVATLTYQAALKIERRHAICSNLEPLPSCEAGRMFHSLLPGRLPDFVF